MFVDVALYNAMLQKAVAVRLLFEVEMGDGVSHKDGPPLTTTRVTAEWRGGGAGCSSRRRSWAA